MIGHCVGIIKKNEQLIMSDCRFSVKKCLN